MSERDFFSEVARKGVTDAVVDIERQTAGEIVVVVRRTSGTFREVDLAAGAALAFAALLVLLFDPWPVAVAAIPVDVALAFAAGAALSASVGPLKRALLGPRRAGAQVRARAREAFVEQGVSRTRGRTGILVYVSTFERRVELVPDTAVDPQLVEGPGRAMGEAVRRADLPAFLAALRALGPSLGAALPRSADDVNELPDAPVMS